MKKTKNITKYSIDWQVIRVKNHRLPANQQINNVIKFYLKNRSYNNWERIYNYLQGLYLGYKNENNKLIVAEGMRWFENNKTLKISAELLDFECFKIEDLILVYKDLYKRNEKWLNSGYKNKELNIFLKKLWSFLNNKDLNLKKNYDKIVINKNTYKFIYR